LRVALMGFLDGIEWSGVSQEGIWKLGRLGTRDVSWDGRWMRVVDLRLLFEVLSRQEHGV
jgi:hypothetical protein